MVGSPSRSKIQNIHQNQHNHSSPTAIPDPWPCRKPVGWTEEKSAPAGTSKCKGSEEILYGGMVSEPLVCILQPHQAFIRWFRAVILAEGGTTKYWLTKRVPIHFSTHIFKKVFKKIKNKTVLCLQLFDIRESMEFFLLKFTSSAHFSKGNCMWSKVYTSHFSYL